MVTYNLTQLQKAETITDLITYANDSTNQIFMGVFVWGVFFIMLLVLKKYGLEKSLVTSSFLCFGLSLFLVQADYLNFIYPLLFLTLTAFTLFYMYVIQR